MHVFELNQRYVKFMPLFSFRKIFISLFIFFNTTLPFKITIEGLWSVLYNSHRQNLIQQIMYIHNLDKCALKKARNHVLNSPQFLVFDVGNLR